MQLKKPSIIPFILGLNLLAFSLFAQKSKTKANWYNLDLQADSTFGVSVEKTYSELLKGKQGKTVIVAVLDGGTDVNHEDLKDVVWTNADEIPDNGIDDDKNGYIDDIHGWNFIGGKDGRHVKEDTYEFVRMYKDLSRKYANADEALKRGDEYKTWLKVKEVYETKVNETNKGLETMSAVRKSLENITQKVGRDSVSLDDLKGFSFTEKNDSIALATLRSFLTMGVSANSVKKQLDDAIESTNRSLATQLNLDFNPREIVGDDYSNPNERYYGNNDVIGPAAGHGTHVAGIIAAKRTNGVGINGVAENVQIMVVRVVPDGDERDKDIANAIRYAVDNGASIVNMSFGKAFSPYKSVIDEAVKYAESKDVLLIHAAGNEHKNNDKSPNFPNDNLLDNTRPGNWMDIGSTASKDNEKLASPYSNWGKKTVDVFAPGQAINSTTPNSSYSIFSGTSMAAPVTSGVAAILRSYYPQLSAEDVKKILMKSSVRVKHKVLVPGSSEKKIKFKKLCKSKGIINAYKAVELAEKKAR
jgi:subtilisin family serine protease